MSNVLTPPFTPIGSAPPSVSPPSSPLPATAQPTPHPFRWTLDQYKELDKIGFFNDKRAMLLDGVICVMPNPNPPHDVILGLTDAWLRGVFMGRHHVRSQMSFNVGEDTDPAPDLAVVEGGIRDYLNAAPREAVLVVEVADSSLFTDTTTKAEKYAAAKVPDYWVLDVENRQLIVFRDPAPLPAALGANAYRQRNTYGPDATVSPLAAPGHAVRVADLLP